MKMMNDIEQRRWLSSFLLIVAGICAYAVIMNYAQVLAGVKAFLSLLSPFFAGFAIAYVLDIPCKALERLMQKSRWPALRKKSRTVSVLLVYAAFVFLIVALLRYLVPQIVRNIVDFATNFEAYYEMVRQRVSDILANENIWKNIDVEALKQSLTLSSIMENVSIEGVWSSVAGIFGASSYLINTAIAFISSIYILLSSESIKKFFYSALVAFIPDKTTEIFLHYARKTNDYFKKYLFCIIVDAAIIGIAAVIGLSAIGMKYNVILGCMVGVTNLIPYFGAFISGAVIVIVALFANGAWSAAAALVLMLALQQIDANIIQPRLYGTTFNMNPFVVILSISVAGKLYGMAGMVIAIPVAALIISIIQDFIDYRLHKKLTAEALQNEDHKHTKEGDGIDERA